MTDWTIESLAAALRAGEITIPDIAQQYVDRIMIEDPEGPNAVLALNPFWMEDAQKLQSTLTAEAPLLHGIPILVKDNIDTYSMGNSAGSVALKDVPVDTDAPLIQKLQAQGALILGKTNLSEWANFRCMSSISGWSSLGGQTHNALNPDWSPSGSSSGSAAAVAANYAVAAIGTETDGSIVSPAAHHGIVGLKPQVGRVSRTGIIPIAWSQDTAGPMTKTVRDSAILLKAISGPDNQDPITLTAPNDLDPLLDAASSSDLNGRRIGVLKPDELFNTTVHEHFYSVIDTLKEAGAQCIELSALPTLATLQDHEITVMTSEFPEALAQYFADRRNESPYRSLSDLHRFNLDHADSVLSVFGQTWFDRCLSAPSTDTNLYQEAQSAIDRFRREMMEVWFREHDLEAIVTPSNGPAWNLDPKLGDRYTGGNSHLAAVSGWPSITLPYAETDGRPLGALFITPAWQEHTLLSIATVFETLTREKNRH